MGATSPCLLFDEARGGSTPAPGQGESDSPQDSTGKGRPGKREETAAERGRGNTSAGAYMDMECKGRVQHEGACRAAAISWTRSLRVVVGRLLPHASSEHVWAAPPQQCAYAHVIDGLDFREEFMVCRLGGEAREPKITTKGVELEVEANDRPGLVELREFP